jgi:acyl-CoA thioester hydrolase
MTFEQRFPMGRSHFDSNVHLRKIAYMDLAAGVRLAYLAAAGFSINSFAHMLFGPVIRVEDLEYFHELGTTGQVRVTLLLAGLSEDGSQFRLRNEFWSESGTLIARLTSLGGWIELRLRRLIVPPPSLVAALHGLDRTTDFECLPPARSKPDLAA